MKNPLYCLSDATFTARLVQVECHPGKGLPITTIVGLAGRSVAESRDRLRAAFQISGIPYPRKRLTINLAPADIPKQGGGFDLGIVASLLQSCRLIPENALPLHAAYIGELGLDGAVRAVPGIIGRIISGKRAGITTFFLPTGNVAQAGLIPGVSLMPISDLKMFYDYCHGLADVGVIQTGQGRRQPEGQRQSSLLAGITGQTNAKRALTVAAAGGHNLLLQGRPGAGKTMLGQALVELLPPLSRDEMLAVTHLASLEADIQSIVTDRPVVMPHHSISPRALVGINQGRPSAVQRAVGGVLLLDELPEFSRAAIEALRQPLDTTGGMPFQLIATANPCPCGFYGHQQAECRCSPYNIKRYRQKLSGPLIDRIDLFVDVEDVPHAKLLTTSEADQVDAFKAAITEARTAQRNRYGTTDWLNATCPDRLFKQTCQLQTAAKTLLDTAAERLDISARSYMRSLRIARSLADAASSADILPGHIAEALSFRPRRMEVL